MPEDSCVSPRARQKGETARLERASHGGKLISY